MALSALGHHARKNGIFKSGCILFYTFDTQDVADHKAGYLSGVPLPVDINASWPMRM